LHSEFTFLEEPLVVAVHEAQLTEHGGASGIRDAGLLASALARPLNAAAYEEPDVARLASLYALGIIRNHPFVDGNKRVGTVLLETFLELNGYTLEAADEELLAVILTVAAHEISDEDFIVWVRAHASKREST
jgi:death on curing protein